MSYINHKYPIENTVEEISIKWLEPTDESNKWKDLTQSERNNEKLRILYIVVLGIITLVGLAFGTSYIVHDTLQAGNYPLFYTATTAFSGYSIGVLIFFYIIYKSPNPKLQQDAEYDEKINQNPLLAFDLLKRLYDGEIRGKEFDRIGWMVRKNILTIEEAEKFKELREKMVQNSVFADQQWAKWRDKLEIFRDVDNKNYMRD